MLVCVYVRTVLGHALREVTLQCLATTWNVADRGKHESAFPNTVSIRKEFRSKGAVHA